MLTTKYHLSSIIAIFFALGLGILIGGTLGQRWVTQTEDHIVKTLVNKFEQQVSLNQGLQKQINYLQLVNQTVSPILEDRTIWWIRPDTMRNDMLSMVMKSAGAHWVEKNMETFSYPHDLGSDHPDFPHLIIVPEAQGFIGLNEQMSSVGLGTDCCVPKLVEVDPRKTQLIEPKEAIHFIYYLKKVMEEKTRATIGYYHYSGME
ncbi:MAG TPA: copper transporter [Bacilli bacterium]